MTTRETQPDRLSVTKTYKLFIDGKFPRSESGRSLAVHDAKGRVLAHVCHASRKDLRDAVSAARKALDPWRGATAYLRGQILYRMAEMMEGKKAEFVDAIETCRAAGGAAGSAKTGRRGKGGQTAAQEVNAAIDRLVSYAGWADKYAQVLGCNNAVAGPYYNFTVPEPTGVVAVIAPDEPALLGLIALVAPVICSGNTAVVVAGEGNAARLCACVLGEVFATSDLPAGVVNILTSARSELVQVVADHRDIDAVHVCAGDDADGAGDRDGGASAEQVAILRSGAGENLKRVRVCPARVDWFDAEACSSPWWIEPFVEFKTVWHPSAV